jgi:hypothetical protein
MLCLILIVGGLLIMMGQHDRSEALFYYFRLEDQVPETHLLRLIEKHISFTFVRDTERRQRPVNAKTALIGRLKAMDPNAGIRSLPT